MAKPWCRLAAYKRLPFKWLNALEVILQGSMLERREGFPYDPFL